MTGGDAMVEGLIANGVDTVFGLPGVQTYPLFDALAKNRNAINTITTRHEQGAAYMAYGYARSTGRPGVYTVVPGPGVLNTTAALCTAFSANAPVLCLTGQVPSQFMGQMRGALHELSDQVGTLRSIIKGADHVATPAEVPAAMSAAFTQMMSGRRGPVAVEMCWDTMAEASDVADQVAAEPEPNPGLDLSAVKAAAELIGGATNIMILTGGGAVEAGAEVGALAELLGAPVSCFRAGKGVVADDHELAVSMVAAYELWEDTDVVIAIGTRAELPYMRWQGVHDRVEKPEGPPHLIRIDIDPVEMQRLVPKVGIVADAADGATALIAAIGPSGKKPINHARLDAARQVAAPLVAKIQPHITYLDVIRAELPRDGFFVKDICQIGFASYLGFPVYEPRTYVTSGYQGTLGFGYATALGVKVGNPDKPVVSVNGDGGFMFNVQEMATAVRYQIGVVAIVFNNHAFGNIRRDQNRLFDGRVMGSELTNPDFMKLADSFGMASYRVDSPESLQPVLRQAIAANAPCLIEVEIDLETERSPWGLIYRSR